MGNVRENGLLLDVADAVAANHAVDWERCAPRATARERRALGHLRTVAGLVRSGIPAEADAGERDQFALSPLVRRAFGALLTVAVLQAAASLAVLPWIWSAYHQAYGPAATFLITILFGYAVLASLLLLGGRRDRRAWLLGAFFALMASIPAAHMLPFALWGAAPAGEAPHTIYLHPFVFRSAVLWWFTREFPRMHRRSRLDDVARRMAVGSAIVMGLSSVAFIPLRAATVAGFVDLDVFMTYHDVSFAALTTLDVAAIAAFSLRARGAASADEFARVLLFGGGFLVWSAGSAAYDLVEVARPGAFLDNIDATPVVAFIGATRLMGISVMVWSVLVRQALDVRMVLRASYRRLLAWQLLVLASAAPLAGLAWRFVSRPERTVAELLVDPWFVVLASASAAGLAAFTGRRRILRRLDDWVYPESADQPRLLAASSAAFLSASDPAGVGEVVQRFVCRGCGVPATLLVAAPAGGATLRRFVAPGGKAAPLEADSSIVHILAATRTPLDFGGGGGYVRAPAVQRP